MRFLNGSIAANAGESRGARDIFGEDGGSEGGGRGREVIDVNAKSRFFSPVLEEEIEGNHSRYRDPDKPAPLRSR